MPPSKMPRGLLVHDPEKATPGFTFYAPMNQYNAYLVDMEGKIVHQWDLPGEPGVYAYLLPNGNLLSAIRTPEGPQNLAATGGRLVELDWDGNLVWEHVDDHQHHDFRRLPNGNTIYLSWRLLDEEMTRRDIGGLPGTEHADGIYGDLINEVNPQGETVWEWFVGTEMDMEAFPIHPGATRVEYGHSNTICPLPDGNLLFNQRVTGLIAIIDKQTKKLKWTHCDWSLGQQHDVQMLANGNLLMFCNGATLTTVGGPEVGSRIVELDPETHEIVWEYHGNARRDFFSWYISGCQRLASGNTLICEGAWGRMFEVTPEGELVWEYVCPTSVRDEHPFSPGANPVFRCYRYAADSPEIRGRLGTP